MMSVASINELELKTSVAEILNRRPTVGLPNGVRSCIDASKPFIGTMPARISIAGCAKSAGERGQVLH